MGSAWQKQTISRHLLWFMPIGALCVKRKKNTILQEKELGDPYHPHFINIAVDFETEDGKKIRSQ